MVMENNRENLGPAEQIIQTLLTYSDHMYHNRVGIVVPDQRTKIGVRWDPVTTADVDGVKKVYRLQKVGRKSARVYVGDLDAAAGNVVANGTVVGRFQPAGLFPEVAEWFYSQIAEVWKLDNEFAARWASYAFGEEHRDLKVALAAFMLVQSRKGDPVTEAGEVLFFDEDYRDVGEAMLLNTRADKRDLSAKMLLRIRDLLSLPQIAKINHDLGFGKSARKPFYGRWPRVVTKWLQYREENPRMLKGLVGAGFRTTVMELARRVGYKPLSPAFFEILRWKQKQADDGRREIAIGVAVEKAADWSELSESQICERIEAEKPGWKRIVGMLPANIGVTRAIMAAAIENDCLSNKDLVIATPTLEELGLLNVQEIRERWQGACKAADDMRSANIARNVRSKDVKEELESAADGAVQNAVEEAVRDLTVYVMVDVSGSMEAAIEQAKDYVAKFVHAFPPEQLHVCTFNTAGKRVAIRHRSAAGVANAFRGVRAGGGTDYSAGVRCAATKAPKEDSDVLFIFVGDEQAQTFKKSVEASGLNPVAFGLLRVQGGFGMNKTAVQDTAIMLGIPCFMIDEETFQDPYAVPRTMARLIEATPVRERAGRAVQRRVSLVDKILQTDLLKKPVWADVA